MGTPTRRSSSTTRPDLTPLPRLSATRPDVRQMTSDELETELAAVDAEIGARTQPLARRRPGESGTTSSVRLTVLRRRRDDLRAELQARDRSWLPVERDLRPRSAAWPPPPWA